MRILILLFISISAFGQVDVESIVKDTKGNPLPFTNIVFLNSNRGTFTNVNGVFLLKNIKETDTIKVTNVSFMPKVIPVKVLQSNSEIILQDNIKELDEVVVRNLNFYTSLKRIGFAAYKERGGFRLMPGHQLAIYIENPLKKEGWIKNVAFGIESFGKCKNGLRIRLLKADNNTLEPSVDLLNENLIINNSKLQRKNKIDVSEFKLIIPNNGIYVLLEWLDIDAACNNNSYTSISANLEVAKNIVWLNYRDKKWSHYNIPRHWNGNYMSPNIGIEVAY